MAEKIITIFSVGFLITFSCPTNLFGYVAASSNYRIERDSINFAGTRSTSSNYIDEDTLGEVGTGRLTSTNYLLDAGYQQHNLPSSITITSPADVTLLPPPNTLQGGVANGSTSWTVTTANPAGYILTIAASAAPALVSGSNNFANYTPAGSDPDYTWAVSASVSEFGFSPESSDLVSKYKDNGTACNIGALDTSSACWDSITTSSKVIASRVNQNNPSGTATTVRFRAEAGSTASQAAGLYVAVITLTAIAL